jgi:hypothetical protein
MGMLAPPEILRAPDGAERAGRRIGKKFRKMKTKGLHDVEH